MKKTHPRNLFGSIAVLATVFMVAASRGETSPQISHHSHHDCDHDAAHHDCAEHSFIAVVAAKKCPTCKSTDPKIKNDFIVKCSDCKGKGSKNVKVWKQCRTCNGNGKLDGGKGKKCGSCNGKGGTNVSEQQPCKFGLGNIKCKDGSINYGKCSNKEFHGNN
jgi:DnaJ-class molecular chaperone